MRVATTGSYDHTARVFQSVGGRELVRLPLGGLVHRADFLSGGRCLRTVTGERDPRIEQCPLRGQGLIRDACSTLSRNLSSDEWRQYLGDRLPQHLRVNESAHNVGPVAADFDHRRLQISISFHVNQLSAQFPLPPLRLVICSFAGGFFWVEPRSQQKSTKATPTTMSNLSPLPARFGLVLS